MNSNLPHASRFTHLDLSTGRSALIPLDIEKEKQRDTLPLLLQAQREGNAVTWAAGMAIGGDLSDSGNGIAVIGLFAAYDLCGGRIKAGQPVYSLAVAVSPRMQHLAWHSLGALYLQALLTEGGGGASLGEMPADHPWVAGFMWPCTELLGEKGKLKLLGYARMAAATVVNRCREVYVCNPSKVTQKEDINPEDETEMFG